MNTYRNILVVIDPNEKEQKALQRALLLADLTKASITAQLSIYDFSYEMTTILSGEERESMRLCVVNDRQLWLDVLLKENNPQNIPISTEVIWHNRPFESIISTVIKNNHDLVIKATHQHDKLKSVIFTPTDWHILRKCPCPVLLVKDHDWPSNGNILAALNVGSDEKEHQSLNKKITKQALSLSKVAQANVHLVNSFPGAPVNVSIEIPDFDMIDYQKNMKAHHIDAMQAHAKYFHIQEKFTHVLEGVPEDIIEAKANELDCELVVLGCVGRTGISAALIGNTAEHVIDQINCDLLALKPDDFVSPITL